MKFFSGKYYKDNRLALLSAVLYNLKWILVVIIVINFLPLLERATSSYGLGDEEAFWSTLIVAVTLCLFIFNKKWQSVCDRITDALNK